VKAARPPSWSARAGDAARPAATRSIATLGSARLPLAEHADEQRGSFVSDPCTIRQREARSVHEMTNERRRPRGP
jgi:hypothetical protein